ncbi:filamentous hemagglutinin N-terminal domain-containing protein [Edwardsiella anguillarum]|nr:filamentous hemagglutinin N-terminal domain-containing protein [Edwardsiella anguillarum]
MILNEVISRNPSLLLGQQEVFGMAADYVLANPNGITCDGCGFINTTRSALVVGNPLVEGSAQRLFDSEQWQSSADRHGRAVDGQRAGSGGAAH